MVSFSVLEACSVIVFLVVQFHYLSVSYWRSVLSAVFLKLQAVDPILLTIFEGYCLSLPAVL